LIISERKSSLLIQCLQAFPLGTMSWSVDSGRTAGRKMGLRHAEIAHILARILRYTDMPGSQGLTTMEILLGCPKKALLGNRSAPEDACQVRHLLFTSWLTRVLLW
jgi:hypothetical protein